MVSSLKKDLFLFFQTFPARRKLPCVSNKGVRMASSFSRRFIRVLKRQAEAGKK